MWLAGSAGAPELAAGVKFVCWSGDLASIDELKGLAKDIRGSMPSGVIAVGLDAEEPQLFVTVSDDLVGRGIRAGTLVQQGVAKIDGRGGGRPDPGSHAPSGPRAGLIGINAVDLNAKSRARPRSRARL